MKKKVLVLGAVTMVAGIVTATASGCSSESSSGDTPTPEAGSDVRSERTPVEAGEEEDAGACPVDPGVTAADLEAKPGYKPGKLQPDTCTSEEITKFQANLKDDTIQTWKDLGKDLSETCAACIITSTAAESWGPVVYTEDSGGDRGFYNFGACFGAAEGNDACGKAIQFLEWCLDGACDECATTQADREACIDDAADTNGVCGDFVTTLQAECKKLQTTSTKCNDIGDAAKFLCGPAAGDGGTDAGDDAADANDQ